MKRVGYIVQFQKHQSAVTYVVSKSLTAPSAVSSRGRETRTQNADIKLKLMTKHLDQVDHLRIFELTQNACIKMCFTKKHRSMNVVVSEGSRKS